MSHASRRALTQVAPGVWVATAGRWSTTTTLVLADDGTCLLVDPALSPQELDALADEIAVRGWRVAAAVATHAHWDHVLWTPRFGDVPRWASGRTVERVRADHPTLVAEAEAEKPGHGAAVTAGLRALPGDRVPWAGPAVLAVVHDAHAPGHLALVVPAARTLLAGDMLSDTEVPLLDIEAADPVGRYRDGLNALARVRAETGLQVLVPGHGSVASGGAIDLRIAADRRYLDELTTRTRRGLGDGLTDPRLADPWLARQHAEQIAAVGRTSSGTAD